MMNKQDILRKLTSRKFWSLVAALVLGILVICKVDNGSAEQIVALVMTFGTIISYVFAEGIADSNSNRIEGGNNDTE